MTTSTSDFKTAKAFADKIRGVVVRGWTTYYVFNPFIEYSDCKTTSEYSNKMVAAWGYPHYVSKAYANKIHKMWMSESERNKVFIQNFIKNWKKRLTSSKKTV